MDSWEDWLFLFPFVWIGLIVGGSILYRRSQDLPLLTKAPADAVFVESGASGRLLEGIRRLGGANNCLMVVVTPTELLIQPQFPLNLMFVPMLFGLEWTLKRHQLRKVEFVKGVFGGRVLVEFTKPGGGETTFALRLRAPDAFLRALGR